MNEEKQAVIASDQDLFVIRNSDIQLFQSRLKVYLEKENPEQYKAETIIKDLVYLLGVSINPKFSYANGFNDFKKQIEKALSL